MFRKIMSTDDTIQEFAPTLRTEQQERALRVALQMLGDLCGFGITYFDLDNSGYVKTAHLSRYATNSPHPSLFGRGAGRVTKGATNTRIMTAFSIQLFVLPLTSVTNA